MLADTSIWIEHFRKGHPRLTESLRRAEVTTHPFVIGELACGQFRRRGAILQLLKALPSCDMVNHEEALAFVDAHRLWGSGLGWIDVHLLAAARLCGERVLTEDRPLARAAIRLDLDAR